MHIKSLRIVNFKSFRDVSVEFNPLLNVLTGPNNSGKTTVLEALALWHECFFKLLYQAKRGEQAYSRGQWVLGPTWNKYFPFDQINSVRSPNFEDIFHQRNKKNKIRLTAKLVNNEAKEQEIGFQIGDSGLNYVIECIGFKTYDFGAFNDFFEHFPSPIGMFYASPVSAIEQVENFATDPAIREAVVNRQSAAVLRNRLYKLYREGATRFGEFQSDLGFLLLGIRTPFLLETKSDIQQETRVVFTYRHNETDTPKDIALLGSGTLQLMEILLNLYKPGEHEKDINLVLLDEPDSHIHRHIQQRLVELLTHYSPNNQVFLSTHNEALIRNISYEHIFHLDGQPVGTVKSIDTTEAAKNPLHFSGIFPSPINPVIRSIGSTTGLDFVNAMESDRLIFVEGEDDARAIHLLLRQQSGSRNRRYMFWVMGGINEGLENIAAYKTVFTSIKNAKSLWDKSVLIFDKDNLSIGHRDILVEKFRSKVGLEAHSWNSYTMESALMTEIDKLARMLSVWKTLDPEILEEQLLAEYQNMKEVLAQRYTVPYLQDTVYRYRKIRDKASEIFAEKAIREDDVKLTTLVREDVDSQIKSGNYFGLMKKEDVEIVISKALSLHGHDFSIESDFIELVKIASQNKSLLLREWDFLFKL